MTRHRFLDLAAAAKADPVRRERIEQFTRAMEDAVALAELRQSSNVTQREMAESLEVSQANISRIEHEEDLYLSTLRGYVEALGGRLEINAVFPDRTVALVAGRRS